MAFNTKLIERVKIGGDVGIFRLEKPEGFKFSAGQWCFVNVPDIGFQDDRGLRRPLSIASSPLDGELVFATRLSASAMKKTMAELSPGATLTLDAPMGVFTLPADTATPLAFLAGGVGITPFRSMIRYSAQANTGHNITLFYSCKSPEETPFLDELLHLPDGNGRIASAVTMTKAAEGSGWQGLSGRLGSDMIRGRLSAWESAAYYIVGPPAMADAMKKTLDEMGIPAERIKMELFAGY